MDENERIHEINKIKADARMSIYYCMKEINDVKDIYPCTIIKDRYSNDYFLFNVSAKDLPPMQEDSVSRETYLEYTKDIYGRGNTIEEAIKDFIEKHQARRKVLIDLITGYYPKIKQTNADDTEA